MRVPLPDAADREKRRASHDGYAPYVVRVASRRKAASRLLSLEAWCGVGFLAMVALGWEIMHPLVLR
jgi:hypothetical protein